MHILVYVISKKINIDARGAADIKDIADVMLYSAIMPGTLDNGKMDSLILQVKSCLIDEIELTSKFDSRQTIN